MTAAALVLALALPAAAQAPRIGAAGAVSGSVSAAATGAQKRALKSGSDVFHKDAVTTDAKGRLQVMLLDQTVFTVGPDSSITLDEFVYDPFTDAGKVTAQVTKGVFRFVTGKVAGKRPADMKIKIPAGTIGIRGTFGAAAVLPGGDTLVALLGPGPDNNGDERVGGLDVDTGKDSQSLDVPGTGVTVDSDGEVSAPFVLTPEQTAQLDAGGGGGPSPRASPAAAEPEAEGEAPSAEGEEESATDESATDAAGQDTAEAGESSEFTADTGESASELGADSNTAAQAAAFAGIQDGIATWDDVRTIPSGLAHYDGSGSWNLTTCNGGSCANNSSGTMFFKMNIDFGARTYGGGGSFTSATDSDSVAGSVSASTTIDAASFEALSGQAAIVDVEGPCTATINLINSGGTAASHASATLTYNNGSNVGSGTVLADKFDGLIPQ